MSRASITIEASVDEAAARRAVHLLVLSVAGSAIAGAASRIIAWNARLRRINRTVDALSGLSDRMLKDIGIERGQILHIAHSGRDAWSIRG